MKKIISSFLIIGVCLCGCNKDNNDVSSTTSSDSISNNSLINSSIIEVNNNLDTPILTLNNDNGVVTWNKINNAVYYNYIINDQEVLTTTGTMLELSDKSNVSVQAIGNNGFSKWSNAITYYDTSDVILEGNGEYYNVYFHDANIETKKVLSSSKITRPSNPQKTNYIFENWYQDPFYTTLFDFDKPIIENTIIYAHFIPNDLINNTYYWIKANDKITSQVQSVNSGWKFIPLIEDKNSSPKTFSNIVNVNNASLSSSADFLVMDGFDDNPGRTYFKNGSSDFSITENGVYKITFSLETLYKYNNKEVHIKYEKITLPSFANIVNEEKLKTPVIKIDGERNLAFISEIEDADSYEVIIDNKEPVIVNDNVIELAKKSHISVRAVKNNYIYSNWSIPKANINYIYEEVIETPTHAYVYFYESNQKAKQVEINTYIEEILLIKDGYNFLGWYLDLAKTKKAEFPYLVTKNVVFYPKWESKDDINLKEYYYLVDELNNKIAGLTWNMNNYDYYEYETPEITLEVDKKYYITSLDGTKKWGPYEVNSFGQYVLYFSEEYIWNENSDYESNVYIASVRKGEITIYFTNALKWSGKIYAYLWNDETGDNQKTWPGNEISKVETNDYGQDIYSVTFDISKYNRVIFNNNSSQTDKIDISNATNNSGYYTKDEKNEKGRYLVGTYTYS